MANEKRKADPIDSEDSESKKPKLLNIELEKQMEQLLQAPIFKKCGFMNVAPTFIEYIYQEKPFKQDVSSLSKSVIDKYMVVEGEDHLDQINDWMRTLSQNLGDHLEQILEI